MRTLPAIVVLSSLMMSPPLLAQDTDPHLELARRHCRADQWVLRIEANHSTVGFTIPIMAGLTRVTGKFTDVACVICYSEDDFADSSVALAVQAASVNTGIAGRDADLASENFFDVANSPEITFVSEAIEQRGDQWVAVGDLTMRGVTHRVELPFVVTGNTKSESGRPTLGVALSTTVDRHDYGVGSDWVHSAIPGFLGDEVAIDIFMYTRSGRKLEELEQR